jgi:hypothetical protein
MIEKLYPSILEGFTFSIGRVRISALLWSGCVLLLFCWHA